MGSPRIATGSDQRHPAAVTTSRRHRPAADANPAGRRLAVLSVTALGVVYGDIGTSPLYAFRACFSPEYGLPRTAAAVYGVLSLIVWSLILIVSVKYILVIMRLDNRGEGGILAPTPGELGRQRPAMRESPAEPRLHPIAAHRDEPRRAWKLQKFLNIRLPGGGGLSGPARGREHVPDDVTLTIFRGFRRQTRDVSRRRQ